jgi:hypothetical protein
MSLSFNLLLKQVFIAKIQKKSLKIKSSKHLLKIIYHTKYNSSLEKTILKSLIKFLKYFQIIKT